MKTLSKVELEQFIKQSNTWSEIERKAGLSVSGSNHKKLQKLAASWQLDFSHFCGYKAASLYKTGSKHVLQKDSGFSRSKVKNCVLDESLIPYKCAVCGQLPKWQGKPLTLILDHINGDGTDHRLENLRFMCPNCNEQLPTNKGRCHLGKSRRFHRKRRIKDQYLKLLGFQEKLE